MIGMVKGTMRETKSVAGLPSPIASFRTNASGLVLPTLKTTIEAVQSGSGDPSHDNVRPITGWSGANVTHAGKNLLDRSEFDDGTYYSNTGNGVTVISSDGRAWSNEALPEISLKKGTYYLSVGGMLGVGSYRLKSTNYDSSSERRFVSTGILVTLTEDDTLRLKIGFGTSDYPFVCYPQIEIGSTATAYHAYNGTNTTITFPDTVYGASLDVGTGVLTENRGIKDLGNLSYIYYPTQQVFRCTAFAGKNNNIICSCYKTNSSYLNWEDMHNNTIQANATDLVIKNTDYSDATAFKTAMTGQKVVYELATPITTQLTPQQIEQLRGENNVFVDCGEVSELKYQNMVVTKLFSKG